MDLNHPEYQHFGICQCNHPVIRPNFLMYLSLHRDVKRPRNEFEPDGIDSLLTGKHQGCASSTIIAKVYAGISERDMDFNRAATQKYPI